MFFILFILWIIFNSRLTLDVVVSGLLISGGLTWFARRFLGLSFDREKEIYSQTGRLVRYTAFLVGEVVKANLAVIRRILTFSQAPDPVLVRFDPGLRSDTAKAILANSITLTPGTITVDVDGDQFLVHALEKEYGTDLDRSGFVERLEPLKGEQKERRKRAGGKEGA